MDSSSRSCLFCIFEDETNLIDTSLEAMCGNKMFVTFGIQAIEV